MDYRNLCGKGVRLNSLRHWIGLPVRSKRSQERLQRQMILALQIKAAETEGIGRIPVSLVRFLNGLRYVVTRIVNSF